jgi:hypothetical protein
MKLETLSAIAVDKGVINLHLNPLLGLLVVAVALIVFGYVAWCGFCLFANFFTGWKGLTRRFPVSDIHKSGRTYQGQTGYFNRDSWNRPFQLPCLFLIEVAQEGLLLTAYFARRSPILIPWADIQKVDDVDVLGLSEVRIIVDYGSARRMTFHLPKEALTAIQESVPVERLHKTDSLSQLIRDRLNHDT